jgi:SAM-dependent methyltransferase
MSFREDTMLEIGLEPRDCECCGSRDAELVFSSHSIVKRAFNTWRFPMNVAVCRTCGFCFVSPGPKADDLARYHAEGLSGYKAIGLAYSIEPRLEVLGRYSAPAGVFAEVGGDQAGEFHQRLSGLFGTIIDVEISEDTTAQFRSVHDLPEESVDVIAHYDVLEHIGQVRPFLASCHRALKSGGVMVCETPDMRLYPRNLVLLEFEHTNHFSVTTLAAVARQLGLEMIEVGHLCSRTYGMVNVFRKTTIPAARPLANPIERLDALACLRGGMDQIRRNELQTAALRERMTDLSRRGKRITVWAVTDLLRRLLDGYELPSTAIIVDADPRRETHLADLGLTVRQPKDCLDHLGDSDLLVICAPRYGLQILEAVTRDTGKTFARNDVVMLGSGPSGEALI